jgi:hypothetical protein
MRMNWTESRDSSPPSSSSSLSSLTNPLLGPATFYTSEGSITTQETSITNPKKEIDDDNDDDDDKIPRKSHSETDISVRIRAFCKYLLHLRVTFCEVYDIYAVEACNKVHTYTYSHIYTHAYRDAANLAIALTLFLLLLIIIGYHHKMPSDRHHPCDRSTVHILLRPNYRRRSDLRVLPWELFLGRNDGPNHCHQKLLLFQTGKKRKRHILFLLIIVMI